MSFFLSHWPMFLKKKRLYIAKAKPSIFLYWLNIIIYPSLYYIQTVIIRQTSLSWGHQRYFLLKRLRCHESCHVTRISRTGEWKYNPKTLTYRERCTSFATLSVNVVFTQGPHNFLFWPFHCFTMYWLHLHVSTNFHSDILSDCFLCYSQNVSISSLP